MRVDLMEHQRDERESAASGPGKPSTKLVMVSRYLRGRLVADESTSAREDLAVAERFDLRLELFDAAAETGSQSLDVEHRVGVPVEEDEDIPRQQRAGRGRATKAMTDGPRTPSRSYTPSPSSKTESPQDKTSRCLANACGGCPSSSRATTGINREHPVQV